MPLLPQRMPGWRAASHLIAAGVFAIVLFVIIFVSIGVISIAGIIRQESDLVMHPVPMIVVSTLGSIGFTLFSMLFCLVYQGVERNTKCRSWLAIPAAVAVQYSAWSTVVAWDNNLGLALVYLPLSFIGVLPYWLAWRFALRRLKKAEECHSMKPV